MNKKTRMTLALIAVGVLTLGSVLISGYAINATNRINDSSFGKCTQDCPDRTQVSCTGSTLSTIDDPEDPGCICDGKEYRCSHKDNGGNKSSNNANAGNGNSNVNMGESPKRKKSETR